ncbi:MAG: RodZ domain-containing protein, partial [bacterium]
MNISEILKKKRTSLKKTLEASAKATKIPLKFVKAMEENKFELLPGVVPAKGFLRIYADFLELDGEGLVETFMQRSSGVSEIDKNEKVLEPKLITTTTTKKKGRKKTKETPPEELEEEQGRIKYPEFKWDKTWNMKLLWLFVIVAVGALMFFGARPAMDYFKSLGAGIIKKPGIVKYQGVNLTLKFKYRSWLRVAGDGKLLYEGILPANSSKVWMAKRAIKVRVGNAAAVSAVFNGKNIRSIG